MSKNEGGQERNESQAVIEFNDTRFAYTDNSWALAIAHLVLGREHLTCIVGPNGSGKSTLLRLAAGILAPAAGMVCLNRCPLSEMSRRAVAQQIAFLPQESLPLFDYSVEMVVQMGRYAYQGWPGTMSQGDRQAVETALSAVKMDSLRGRPLSRLSGGERRRALIAAVLAQEAGLLLLDEPTAALDIHHATAVMRLLADLGANNGRAVVLVTHDLNLAALFADRLIMVANGAIVADGTPAEVICADIVCKVYGADILVRRHPETGGPLVVPRKWPEAAEVGQA